MKTSLLTAFCAGMVVLLNVETLQAEWVGSNLVTNGNFSGLDDNWMGVYTYPWSFSSGKAKCNSTSATTLGIYQLVSFTPGKRYRISGQSSPGPSDGSTTYYGTTQIDTVQLATDFWGPGYSQTLTTKTAEGIFSPMTALGVPNATLFQLTCKGSGVFDNVGMYQVVYSPQINISQKQNGVRINSNTPGGSSANISLTLNNATGYADALTSWLMNWGDGVIESNPTFNSHSHTYSITSGNSQTWTSTFSGTNQAGTVSDTDTVTILRQPDIALMVNGLSITEGQIVEIDIFENPALNLSLLDSQGYLEGASFQIDGKLNEIGWDVSSFLYSGNLFDQSDIGRIYSLTAGVYNTGLGVNSDYLSVDLSIVPEPTTLLLLGLGGIFLRGRCKV